jgi:hypothetical protein
MQGTAAGVEFELKQGGLAICSGVASGTMHSSATVCLRRKGTALIAHRLECDLSVLDISVWHLGHTCMPYREVAGQKARTDICCSVCLHCLPVQWVSGHRHFLCTGPTAALSSWHVLLSKHHPKATLICDVV